MDMVFTTGTHRTRGSHGQWDYACVPVASRLNSDGRHNGITLVQAVGEGHRLGTLVDVGTCTLFALKGDV